MVLIQFWLQWDAKTLLVAYLYVWVGGGGGWREVSNHASPTISHHFTCSPLDFVGTLHNMWQSVYHCTLFIQCVPLHLSILMLLWDVQLPTQSVSWKCTHTPVGSSSNDYFVFLIKHDISKQSFIIDITVKNAPISNSMVTSLDLCSALLIASLSLVTPFSNCIKTAYHMALRILRGMGTGSTCVPPSTATGNIVPHGTAEGYRDWE